ncbi:MAG: hypothetical protein VBE63_08225 [Lamprobacter sp.]|uniref:hypothetical protein n=1 Tax=Lamprobacter sp. TaxID=3100796 RepID=UPI002B25FC5D|nr:hypothetical protein [Lamprobacter sp.]MEA3639915.1 hypothetical protein [Lamprobacter sp.]
MKIQVQGLYKVWVEREGVITQETPWFDNLITDNGMDLIGYHDDYGVNCYVGSGTADARYDDVALGRYVASVDYLGRAFTDGTAETPPYRGYKITYRSGIGSIAGPVSEVGIGPGSSNLFSRALLPVELLLDGDVDRLYVMWEFRQCIPTESYEFSVEVAGAMRDCVAFPINTGHKHIWLSYSGWNFKPGEPLFRWKAPADGTKNKIRLDGSWVLGDPSELKASGTDSYSRRRSYIPGSHRLTFDVQFGPGLTGMIDGLQFGQGRDWLDVHHSNGGTWQVDFTPEIALEDHQRIHFTFDLSWARCGSSSDGEGDPGTPHTPGESYPEPEGDPGTPHTPGESYPEPEEPTDPTDPEEPIDPSTWIESVDAEFWPTQRLVLGVLPAEGDSVHIETWESASDTVFPSDDVIASVNAKTAETGVSAAYGAVTAEGYTLTFSIAESTGAFDAEVTVAQHEDREYLGEITTVFTSRRYRLYRQ